MLVSYKHLLEKMTAVAPIADPHPHSRRPHIAYIYIYTTANIDNVKNLTLTLSKVSLAH